MPNFFIPGFSELNHQESLYTNIKNYLRSIGFEPNENRVYKISHLFNGYSFLYTVGEVERISQELIIAIFETNSGFLACSASKGALKGEPMTVRKNANTAVTYFDQTAI